ncbi:hypothetical protein N5V81_13230 [Escherichia coli]|nr:hypothetical protein [Escherichia coli]
MKQRAIYLTLTTAIGSGSSNYSYTLTTGLTDTELAGVIEFSAWSGAKVLMAFTTSPSKQASKPSTTWL